MLHTLQVTSVVSVRSAARAILHADMTGIVKAGTFGNYGYPAGGRPLIEILTDPKIVTGVGPNFVEGYAADLLSVLIEYAGQIQSGGSDSEASPSSTPPSTFPRYSPIGAPARTHAYRTIVYNARSELRGNPFWTVAT